MGVRVTADRVAALATILTMVLIAIIFSGFAVLKIVGLL
jgi:hypothetical protein